MADNPVVKPICFMVMPYGVKDTHAADPTAPSKVDFNRLWDAALKPAIQKAGYLPIRADQDAGASIITEMIERLAISDLVLADVSIANGNVYYEVGIRHAAKRAGCIMTAATWAKPLFDIDQMRQVRYPLPAESISDATAVEIIEAVVTAIPKLNDGHSPFYQVFPDSTEPKYDTTRTTAFKDSLEQLSQFQSAVAAVRVASKDVARQQAVDLRDRYLPGGPVMKAVAIELLYLLRDCTDFATTLEFIDALPADLRSSALVKEQRALAESKVGNHDQAIGALLELIKLSGDSSERQGLLGGRYKKKWSASKDPAHLDRAIEAYEQGMKLDLNDYYPSCNLPRLYRARGEEGDDDKAKVAAAIAMTACERAKQRNSRDEWLNPTLLGAAFDAGDVSKAKALAKDVRKDGPAAWKLSTTLEDCRVSAKLHEQPKQDQLLTIVEQLAALLPPAPTA